MFEGFKNSVNFVKEKFLGSKVGKVVTVTASASALVCPNVFAADGSVVTSGLSDILSAIMGMFSNAQTAGIAVAKAGIGMGIVFLAAKWLWGKAKGWLFAA